MECLPSGTFPEKSLESFSQPSQRSSRASSAAAVAPVIADPIFALFQDHQRQRDSEEKALRTFQTFAVANCLSSTAYFISHFLLTDVTRFLSSSDSAIMLQLLPFWCPVLKSCWSGDCPTSGQGK